MAQTLLSLRGSAQENMALWFDHDAPMIAAILGVLKAGRTYVPLDPSFPRERIAFILDNSNACAIVTNGGHFTEANEVGRGRLPVVNVDELPATTSDENPDLSVSPDASAYILYTSGSTGYPKGVLQNHRNVLHFVRNYTNALHINADDRLTLLASYSFDAAVMDIFGALLNGAVLYPIDVRAEGIGSLAGWLSDHQITIYHSTPTVFRCFAGSLSGAKGLHSIRLVVMGGESVEKRDVDLYKRCFSDDCLFINGLGPTESTIALQYFLDKETPVDRTFVPVGYPVEDTEVILLDDAGEPTEIYGEIGIRSAHVTPGYWQRPDLTQAAFLPDPEGGDKRIYRTGDMGRLLADGSIQFQGRRDFQVKIRGFRIEIGEIESTLATHPALEAAAVAAYEQVEGEKQLVAYVAGSGRPVDADEVRGFLQQKLPEYMVPSQFVFLEALPLLANGKIDRRALPAPEGPAVASHSGLIPMDTLEFRLVRTWEHLLGVNGIGPRDNFFQLGGHSLLVARILVDLEKEFGTRLSMATIFQAPTIQQLAAVIQGGRSATRLPLQVLPIQPEGSRPPLFFLGVAPSFCHWPVILVAISRSWI